MKKILGIVIILLALSTPVDAHFIWGDADVERDVIAGGNVYGENLFPDNWDNAYGWGDHSLVGYLTSYNETDPVFTDHDAFAVSSLLIGQWNNAYGWGNHASAGYLTSYDETDPVFLAHDAFDITSADITLLGNTSGENSGDQDLSGKEDVGVASGLISIHTTTHPIPTTRDARNEIAKGEDDNFVTDADITLLGNTSGTNTNDVTITDTDEIDLTITLQDIKADIKSDSIDETKLDTSTNISLNLADTSVQPNDPLTTLDTTVTGSQLNQMYTDTHIPATGSDTSKIDISVTGQEIGATITANSIDTGDLTSAIGTSLGKADSATQPTDLLDYFLEDGQSDNIVNGTFDLTTTGKLGATVLENTAGDLKLQPDETANDISLFEDATITTVTPAFTLWRNTDKFWMYGDAGAFNLRTAGKKLQFNSNKQISFKATGGHISLQPDGYNVVLESVSNGNPAFQHEGEITSLSASKYIQYIVDTDGYYKTTPEDANILGWNIDLPLDLLDNNLDTTGTVTADSFNGKDITLSEGNLTAPYTLNFKAGSNFYIDVPNTKGWSIKYSGSTSMVWRGNTTWNQMVMSVRDTVGRQLILADQFSNEKNFDHDPQDNPTFYVQSATSPDTDNTQWLSLAHDQTDALLNVGKGDLKIDTNVAVDGDITADNLGTASAEDVGYFEPAKGTDDNFVTDYQLSILSTLVSHTWVNS